MGQEPTVSADTEKLNETADENRSLADDLNAVAGAVAAIGAMVVLRNEGSLSAIATRFSKQVWAMGTRLVGGQVMKMAMDGTNTSDLYAKTVEADQNRLDEVENA